MPNTWTKLLIIALLVIIVGLPFAFQRAGDEIPVLANGDPESRLVLISPHNEAIRYEFDRAFNRWRAQQSLGPVVFDWRSSGGTSDLRKQVFAEFTRAAERGVEDRGIGYDLFFGGGDVEHNVLAAGLTVKRDGKDVRISLSVPIQLPPGMFETVFPTPDIGGEQLHHPRLYWVGAALSSFGIVYNRDVLGMLGLPEPTTWADLQDPRYLHWLALADPGHSGSVAASYHSALRRLGWTEGWGILRRTFANARYFTASGSKVAVDVSAGEAAAGLTIDFFGRYQAGAVGGDRVGYVDPRYMTAITADPISILRGAPHRELANQFVVWLLTPEAQGLWQRRVGTPGGPERFELRRLPIRRDMYTAEEMRHWTDQGNPFDIAKPFAEGYPNYYRTVALVSHAMAIDIHEDLQAAWRTILKEPVGPRRNRMVELFDAMPEQLALKWPDETLARDWQTILDDPQHPRREEVVRVLQRFMKSLTDRYSNWKDTERILEDRLAWTRFFQDNYRQIQGMGAKPGR